MNILLMGPTRQEIAGLKPADPAVKNPNILGTMAESTYYAPPKTNIAVENHIFCRRYIFKWLVVYCHVNFQWCICTGVYPGSLLNHHVGRLEGPSFFNLPENEVMQKSLMTWKRSTIIHFWGWSS